MCRHVCTCVLEEMLNGVGQDALISIRKSTVVLKTTNRTTPTEEECGPGEDIET